ncbi:MAG: tetratricopeptide repeat protein [Acidobacteriia bacterium]|nr:tetratricopeptide repeat protein [Terriglobia bacterium]
MGHQRLWSLATAWAGLLSFLLLFRAAPGLCQQTFVVEGQVLTDRGMPPAKTANLHLETQEGQVVADQPADSRGQFRFINLSRKAYRLTVTADGFQTQQQWLDVRRGDGRYLITITLTSLGKAKSKGAMVSITDLSAPKKARKEHEKGQRAFQKENLPEARRHLENAVAEYPCYARAQTSLGMTLELQGENAAAESAFRKAVECDAGFHEVHVQLGILLNHQKRFAESAADLRKVIGHFPGSWQLSYQLAAAECGLGQYQQAEQEYLRAESMSSEVPAEIHVRLADVYTRQEAYADAYAELQAYLRAEPQGRFAAKATDVIRRMEKTGVLKRSRPPDVTSTPHKD